MSNRLIIIILLSTFLLSCEKVVNIDLNEAAPQYVVEGEVFEGTDTVRVLVSLTTDYYGHAPQVQVSDALVTIQDDAGNTDTIPMLVPGRYELPGFTGFAGRKYRLQVVAGGRTFTASALMPQPVLLDSISSEFREEDFRSEGYEVAARFTDPGGVANYYRLVTVVNDTLQNTPQDLYLLSDKYNDGRAVKADLFRRFKEGDKIAFELRGMDEHVADFFTSLNEVLNNQSGPAPANPNSNIQGGALGYFGAFTSSRKEIVITP